MFISTYFSAICSNVDSGDMEESYYAKIASTLKKCLKYASSNRELLEKQLSESEEILELAAKVGWGLSEHMREIYSMYFNEMKKFSYYFFPTSYPIIL